MLALQYVSVSFRLDLLERDDGESDGVFHSQQTLSRQPLPQPHSVSSVLRKAMLLVRISHLIHLEKTILLT